MPSLFGERSDNTKWRENEATPFARTDNFSFTFIYYWKAYFTSTHFFCFMHNLTTANTVITVYYQIVTVAKSCKMISKTRVPDNLELNTKQNEAGNNHLAKTQNINTTKQDIQWGNYAIGVN